MLIITFLLFFVRLTSLYGQEFDIIRGGSAHSLKGKVCVLSVFVSEPLNQFEWDEKLEIVKRQKKAQDWIINEAIRYQINVEFENRWVGLRKDITTYKIPQKGERAQRREWIAEVMKKVGYVNVTTFYSSLKRLTGASNIAIIFYAKQSGRSFAISCSQCKVSDNRFLETAVVYQKWESGRHDKYLDQTIAHELLHLFGAWDLYEGESSLTREKAELAKQMFPDDIMHTQMDDIERVKITSLTAWLIGWPESYNTSYNNFKPNYVRVVSRDSNAKTRKKSYVKNLR